MEISKQKNIPCEILENSLAQGVESFSVVILDFAFGLVFLFGVLFVLVCFSLEEHRKIPVAVTLLDMPTLLQFRDFIACTQIKSVFPKC